MSDTSEPAGTTTSSTDGEPNADAAASAPGSHRLPRSSRHGSFWRELPILIIIALVLALLIKTFLVQAFYIPSASMENTLQGGNPNGVGSSKGHGYDRVLVNKLVYDFRDPRRGEIVVFKRPPNSSWPPKDAYTTSSNGVVRFFHDIASAIGIAPSGGSDFIKRVIGVGGDTISCQNDVLSVNGKTLTEPFLFPGSHACSSEGFEGKTVHVPKGQLFVMGDHRDDSDDSRANGDVPVSDVIGKAFVVIWPVGDWKTLPVPSTFKQPGLSAAAASSLTPLAGGGLAVLPLAAIRWRRRSRGSRKSSR